MADLQHIPLTGYGCEGCGREDCEPYCTTCGDYNNAYISQNHLEELAAQYIKPIDTSLSADQLSMMDAMLRIQEHETHRLAKEDYLDNNGRNWRELNQRHNNELDLRQRFGLPDHEFGQCCIDATGDQPDGL